MLIRRYGPHLLTLLQAAEANMSMGNVTPFRVNDQYYRQAMVHLREAAQLSDYALPVHLKQCVHSFLA